MLTLSSSSSALVFLLREDSDLGCIYLILLIPADPRELSEVKVEMRTKQGKGYTGRNATSTLSQGCPWLTQGPGMPLADSGPGLPAQGCPWLPWGQDCQGRDVLWRHGCGCLGRDAPASPGTKAAAAWAGIPQVHQASARTLCFQFSRSKVLCKAPAWSPLLAGAGSSSHLHEQQIHPKHGKQRQALFSRACSPTGPCPPSSLTPVCKVHQDVARHIPSEHEQPAATCTFWGQLCVSSVSPSWNSLQGDELRQLTANQRVSFLPCLLGDSTH